MFLINNEILSSREHPEEYAWLMKKLNEIKDSKKRYVTFNAFPTATYQEDESGRKRKSPKIRVISAESVLMNEDMDWAGQSWAYFSHQSALKNENGSYSLKSKGMPLSQSNTFDSGNKSDRELIFYLRHVSQNRFVVEVDEEKDNREKAEKIANETEAKSIVYSVKSPINPEVVGSEDAMRNLAATWGVPGINDLSLHEIQNHLWDRVELSQNRYSQTKRGYKEFVDEALKLGDGSKRTTIILGIQKGVLVFGDDNLWYLHTKGGAKQALCPVFVGQDKQRDEILIKYLVSNDTAYEMTERAVIDGDNTVLKESLGKAEVSYEDMKAEAEARLGYPKAVAAKTSKVNLKKALDGNIMYKE